LPEPQRTEYRQLRYEGLRQIRAGNRLLRDAQRLWRDVVLEQAGELAACGLSLDVIAEQMGMPPARLRQLLERAAAERDASA
jgi:hypothetical protein